MNPDVAPGAWSNLWSGCIYATYRKKSLNIGTRSVKSLQYDHDVRLSMLRISYADRGATRDI